MHNTKEHIKKTFLSIYENKPLVQITVSELIRACNIARGTFYFHFENIQELYHECENDIINKMEVDLDQVVLNTVGKNREEYIKVYGRLLESYKDDIDFFKCLLRGSEEALFRSAWFESIRRNYTKAMNFSHDTSPAKREYLIHFFSGGLLAILSNWVLNDCRESGEEIAAISEQALSKGTF